MICTFIVLVLLVNQGYAQNQGLIFDFGIGVNPISSKGDNQRNSGAGLSLYLNSYYCFSNNFAFGAELMTSSSLMSGDSPYIDVQTTGINALLLGGRYYIRRHNGFVFFGIKAGRYKIKPEGSSYDFFLFLPLDVEEFTFEQKNVLGFSPEIGRTFGHFQIAFSVHFPSTYNASVRGSSGSRIDVSSNFRLYQLKIGVSLYKKEKFRAVKTEI